MEKPMTLREYATLRYVNSSHAAASILLAGAVVFAMMPIAIVIITAVASMKGTLTNGQLLSNALTATMSIAFAIGFASWTVWEAIKIDNIEKKNSGLFNRLKAERKRLKEEN